MTAARDHGYLDTRQIDWSEVRCAVYEIRQLLRYEYPGPIRDVRHMLMLVPADEIGGQRLIDHQIVVHPLARPRYSEDQFGNRVCHIALPLVEGALQFDVTVHVERSTDASSPAREDAEEEWYFTPSPLTEPSPGLRETATRLAEDEPDAATLAERINGCVYAHVTYTAGATGVRTTANDALEQRAGVCQDYAHLMIALCRLNGLAARYVSGHLLGEGAMHAWVEVLLPDPTAESAGVRTWQPFDPTHDRRAGMSYITIAIGRDYGDVSPTRGSFRAPYAGHLAQGHKLAGVLNIEPV